MSSRCCQPAPCKQTEKVSRWSVAEHSGELTTFPLHIALATALGASKHAKDAHELQQSMQSGATAISTIFKALVGGGGQLTSSEAELQSRCQELAVEVSAPPV